jgi:exonuclease VII small subunit
MKPFLDAQGAHMHSEDILASPRRSSRVPAAMPILVTSLNGAHYSEVCETLVVNAHGCAIRSRAKLDPGVSLHFHSKDGRGTIAQVVSCQPMDSQSWRLGAQLEHPGNFWGLQNLPKDWPLALPPALPKLPQLTAPVQNTVELIGVPVERFEATPKLSEEDVKKVILELVRPLHAEIAGMKEKLARADANRSRFDVSLASIPAELEQQLEQRLRQDLGPKVVNEAREQSSRTLAAAKTTIEKMVAEVHEEFQRRSKAELAVVEERAGQISTQIVETVREQLRDGVGDLQRKLADGRNQLKRTSEELLTSLQTSLSNEHNMRREELEQVRVEVAGESLRLHEQIEQLDNRVSALNDSLQSWESGLDGRLTQMATETLSNTREQIESAGGSILQELKSRGAQTIDNQLDEAAGNMKIIQKGIVASLSDSLKAQTAESLGEFEHSMNELAQSSMERCRDRIASGLNAVVKNLGEQF